MKRQNDTREKLNAVQHGDARAAEDLLTLVYDDLRRLASRKLASERPGQTLQATALVHEAYMAVVGSDERKEWDHRGHFFMAAAEAMRRILINRALEKQTLKRGGHLQRIDFEEAELEICMPVEDLLDLDDALGKLAEQSPQEANLVKLRYFAGLTLDECAEALCISRATASRYWAYARAFLKKTMTELPDPP